MCSYSAVSLKSTFISCIQNNSINLKLTISLTKKIIYLKQVFCLRINIRYDVIKISSRNSRSLKVGPQDGGVLRPLFLARNSDDVEDFVQLVHLILAREERLPQEQFCKDAAAGPDVHRRCVGDAHQNLGGSIP
jgi:hypothetical protein